MRPILENRYTAAALALNRTLVQCEYFTGWLCGCCITWALGRELMILLFCQERPPCPISTIYNRATECSNIALTASKQVSRVQSFTGARAVHGLEFFLRRAARALRSRSDMRHTHTYAWLSLYTGTLRLSHFGWRDRN